MPVTIQICSGSSGAGAFTWVTLRDISSWSLTAAYFRQENSAFSRSSRGIVSSSGALLPETGDTRSGEALAEAAPVSGAAEGAGKAGAMSHIIREKSDTYTLTNNRFII